MSLIDDLPSKHKTISKLWRGKVATTPTSVKQLISVIIWDMSHDLRWDNCYWQPRLEPVPVNTVVGKDADNNSDVHLTVNYMTKILLPKRDDPCMCVFDNYNRIWVVTWWPY